MANEAYNTADVLTNIGIEIWFGGTQIKWATDYEDLYVDPETLDVTPLSAKVQMSVAGLINLGLWGITYNMNEADYDFLKGKVDSDEAEAVEVRFVDKKIKFVNKATCTSTGLSGGSVNSVAKARASFSLSNQDGWQKEKIAD